MTITSQKPILRSAIKAWVKGFMLGALTLLLAASAMLKLKSFLKTSHGEPLVAASNSDSLAMASVALISGVKLKPHR